MSMVSPKSCLMIFTRASLNVAQTSGVGNKTFFNQYKLIRAAKGGAPPYLAFWLNYTNISTRPDGGVDFHPLHLSRNAGANCGKSRDKPRNNPSFFETAREHQQVAKYFSHNRSADRESASPLLPPICGLCHCYLASLWKAQNTAEHNSLSTFSQAKWLFRFHVCMFVTAFDLEPKIKRRHNHPMAITSRVLERRHSHETFERAKGNEVAVSRIGTVAQHDLPVYAPQLTYSRSATMSPSPANVWSPMKA